MFTVRLSQIKALPFDFDEAVEEFIAAKKEHAHKIGEAAPSAPHAWIEQAVKRVTVDGKPDDFIRACKIEDDTPPPPTVDQRKSTLAATVQLLAQSAIDKIDPPLKRRLSNMDYVKALSIEEKKRSAAQAETIRSYQGRQVVIEAILYQFAMQESQIHDLTAETIDGWTPAPF